MKFKKSTNELGGDIYTTKSERGLVFGIRGASNNVVTVDEESYKKELKRRLTLKGK